MTKNDKVTKGNTAGDFRMKMMVVKRPFNGNHKQPDITATALLLDC